MGYIYIFTRKFIDFLNEENDNKMTPLYLAVKCGMYTRAEILLDNDAGEFVQIIMS